MPLYAYICTKEHTTRGIFPWDKIPKRIKCSACGRRARRILACLVAPSGNFPQTSTAAGVAISQIESATKASREPGMIPVEFNSEGDAILTSRQHRHNYLKSVGLFDKDACYGDPTPSSKAELAGEV